MPRKNKKILDFSRIKTYSIQNRECKISVDSFISLNSLPASFKNRENVALLAELSKQIITAYRNKKKIVFMIGAHVIKCGLSLYIIDLMKRGIISHVALNGAGSIHDFEIAFAGKTSEDVKESIEDGSFGMAEETGRMMNEALKDKKNKNIGYGEIIGKRIDELNLKFKEYSILYWSFKLGIPVTVHVAIGTDIIHQHPSCDGSSIGRASYADFKIFCKTISQLEEGVILNIGSAVILPEVFLKALSIGRNLGFDIKNITTANLDMIKHYRPTFNVVERPTSLGGKGYSVIEKHEVTIPNLYQNIIKTP